MEELEMLREENLTLKSELSFLREVFSEERNERKELNSLILRRAGFFAEESKNSSEIQFPLGQHNPKWTTLRSKLEANSRKSPTQTPEQVELEKKWKDKVAETNKEVEQLLAEGGKANSSS